jgi:hypothetical protein
MVRKGGLTLNRYESNADLYQRARMSEMNVREKETKARRKKEERKPERERRKII